MNIAEEYNKSVEELDETKITEASDVLLLLGDVGTYVILRYEPNTELTTIEEHLEDENNYFELMSSPIEDDPEYKTLPYAMELANRVAIKYNIGFKYLADNVNYATMISDVLEKVVKNDNVTN